LTAIQAGKSYSVPLVFDENADMTVGAVAETDWLE
jgi:hypothetical protein